VLCSNTEHLLADYITEAVDIPLLHIADATADAIQRSGHKRVGLLGTKFTMEQSFYADRLRQRFGIETVVPGDASRQRVHNVIYDELCHGVIREQSREIYREIIAGLALDGAESVILGYAEIGLLISQADSGLPIYDTTAIHAGAAVEFAMK
jgi:aspartate racemase